MTGLARHLNQDERELADLGKADADQQRRRQRLAEEQRDHRPDRPLADHDEPDQHAQQADVVDDHAQVDQDADRDEEERDERVAQGQEPGQHLVRVVRLIDEEPSQERAERQRQPGRLGDRRGAETEGERYEQQEFLVPRARHSRQDLGQDARGEIEERHQDRGRRQERLRDREDPVALHRAEGRDQDDQDDGR